MRKRDSAAGPILDAVGRSQAERRAREARSRRRAAASRRRAAARRRATRPHVYMSAQCDACGRTWPLDDDGDAVPQWHAATRASEGPDPLDGDWYTRLDADGIGPVALCPAPCGAFVYLQPSRWVRRPVHRRTRRQPRARR